MESGKEDQQKDTSNATFYEHILYILIHEDKSTQIKSELYANSFQAGVR